MTKEETDEINRKRLLALEEEKHFLDRSNASSCPICLTPKKSEVSNLSGKILYSPQCNCVASNAFYKKYGVKPY